MVVVHVEGGAQALRNALIAKNEGADGIFLINHSIPYSSLIECYLMIKKKLPDFWIGLNCLDLGGLAVKFIPKDTEGLWVDNAGISENNSSLEGAFSVGEAKKFDKLRQTSGWKGIYFGGVAFKYQNPISNVRGAAKIATSFVDVVTTSGEGTGMEASISKIREMRMGVGDFPLALASGVTPKNVHIYKPYVDCFLVATGISDSHTELNRSKVRALVKALKK